MQAMEEIKVDLADRRKVLLANNKLLEEQRLTQRTQFDLEMMNELGYCSGIENYSRYLSGRAEGEPPPTLFDYLPADGLLVVDESHVTIPQIGAMFKGDRARKETLVEYGFRLPSALDNRPLRFEEFEALAPQTIYVSATPGKYELEKSGGDLIDQVVRPTGLLDPIVEVRPVATRGRSALRDPQARGDQRARVGDHPNQTHGGRPDRIRKSMASACVTCTRTSIPWNGSKSSVTCAGRVRRAGGHQPVA